MQNTKHYRDPPVNIHDIEYLTITLNILKKNSSELTSTYIQRIIYHEHVVIIPGEQEWMSIDK